ncbi:MAG: Alanine racemase [Myxococcaceae bacterium]|nr:Alanine racemase [Myxococcaceae bacterium]
MDPRAREAVNATIPPDPPPAPPSSPSRRQADVASSVGPHDSVRVLKPRRAAPADAMRPTRAEVNLAALRHNLRVVARHAKEAGGAQVWPVLKADGYGHGAPAVARTLERAGAEGFCVALLEEAIELRDAGIHAPILVMGGFNASSRGACEEIASRDVVPVVYDLSQIEGLARAARAMGRPTVAHLKVDTGMARLGVRMADLETFAEKLAHFPEVRITGLMTHLACADAEESALSLPDPREGRGPRASGFTAEQVALFEEATRRLKKAGAIDDRTIRHAANSAALLRGDAVFDAVRPGIAIFGVSPVLAGKNELRAAMRVRSEVVDVRTLEAGESVGYGALYRTKRTSRIATIPMGYADGLSRHLSNRGHVLVRGRRAPVVGAVSMDMSMIDVTDIPGSCLGDEVVVLGAQEGVHGKDAITADEIAAHGGTIAWEVLTSISRRVPRFYREP